MAILLQHFQFLYSFVFGCVEKEERWHRIGENPNKNRDEDLSQRNSKQHRIGDKLEKVDNNAATFSKLITGKLRACLVLVQEKDPFGIIPEILASLQKSILRFFKNEFDFEIEGALLIPEQLSFLLIHFLMFQYTVCGAPEQPSNS